MRYALRPSIAQERLHILPNDLAARKANLLHGPSLSQA